MSSKKLRDVREEVAGCQTPLPAGGTRYSPYANLNLKIISHPSESDGCELHLKISMCPDHHHAGASKASPMGSRCGWDVQRHFRVVWMQCQKMNSSFLFVACCDWCHLR